MGILSATPIEKKIYKVDIITNTGLVNTITVSDDGLYIVYYIKEGKSINRIGRITNIIHNQAVPQKSYILFDMSEDNSSIKERIHFCQIQTIVDVTEKNAYKIALEHGFQGTLCDWMESMRGNDGLNAYQMAIEKGLFEGTEDEWFVKYGEVGLVNEKKMDKVQDAKPGNIAAFGADGNVYDSGLDSINPSKVNVFIGYNSINNIVKDCIPKANDICIVKKPINQKFKDTPTTEINDTLMVGEPLEYTAYVHDGKQWRAMRGNYDASNVYLGENLKSRFTIGNFRVNNNELTEFETIGMNLIDLWNAIFVKEPIKEPESETGILIILSDPGTNITYKHTNEFTDVSVTFISTEMSTSIKVPLGTWEVTGVLVNENGTGTSVRTALVEEKNCEYIADVRSPMDNVEAEVEI